MLLEYDGTHYVGSQFQTNGPTIQSSVEEACHRLSRLQTRVAFAGRTDSGVHAEGQVAAVTVDGKWTSDPLKRALNALLPADIAVKAIAETPLDFDPRRHARRRWYRYIVENRAIRSPLTRYFTWHVRGEIDLSAIRTALPWTVGERDYAAFAAPMPMKSASTIRKVYTADAHVEGSQVIFDIEANAFLPHQVRRTVGALVAVGTGTLSVREFAAAAEAAVPSTVGPSAPSCGLRLMRVTYDVPWFDQHAVESAQGLATRPVVSNEYR